MCFPRISVCTRTSRKRCRYTTITENTGAQHIFLAVLGDQRSGNNIEAPEGLIRKIVREESGGKASTYRFVAQLDRKIIFDETISEGKLRQMQTGQNQFEF